MENMIRPEAVVLADNALIPPANLISPPPNQFTHDCRGYENGFACLPWRQVLPRGRPAGIVCGNRIPRSPTVMTSSKRNHRYSQIVLGTLDKL